MYQLPLRAYIQNSSIYVLARLTYNKNKHHFDLLCLIMTIVLLFLSFSPNPLFGPWLLPSLLLELGWCKSILLLLFLLKPIINVVHKNYSMVFINLFKHTTIAQQSRHLCILIYFVHSSYCTWFRNPSKISIGFFSFILSGQSSFENIYSSYIVSTPSIISFSFF